METHEVIFLARIKMDFITKETYEKNGVEVIVDNNNTLWLNEKHIKEGLDLANLAAITGRYDSNYRKHKSEIIDEPNEQPNRIFCAKT